MSIRQAEPFAGQRRDLVTFRDPEKTSLKNSFQEFVSLRPADLRVSPTTVVGLSFSKHFQIK